MANKKIFADLTALTTAAADDVLPIVDDTTGTPTTKKISVSNLMAQAPVQSVAGRDGAVTLSNTDISGLGTAATSATTDFSPAFFSTVTESTTARTLSDSDNGKVILCTNVGQVTVTVPSGLTAGFSCTVVQSNTGTVTIAGSGATINGFGSKTATGGQYAALNVIPVGTNSYVVAGDSQTAPLVNGFSIDLDGNSDYVSGNATTTIGSVSMWFKSPNNINNTSVASHGLTVLLGQAGSDYVFGLGGDTVGVITDEVVTIDAGTQRYAACSSTNTLTANTWHHLFAAWQTSSETVPSAAGYDFWINGVKATNAGNSGWTTGNANVTSGQVPDSLANGFRVGCRASGSYFFDGLIDEFALWSGDVSGDVANIYNSGNGAVDLSDSAVVGTTPNIWWRMGDDDGGTGSTITNQGSNGTGSNGTLNGTAAFSSDVP